MSENWANRQRRTNELVRRITTYLLTKPKITPSHVYGLCKLSWITNSFSGDDAAYIKSTKIPALGEIFDRDYAERSLDYVAKDISDIIGDNNIQSLILSHTGFTNFYKAYRNTARDWIKNNFELLLPMFKAAYNLNTDNQGLELIGNIAALQGVPKANHEDQLMRPEYLLTPLFFALDQRHRFPLINGNKGVKKLLSALRVTKAPLGIQYQKMIGLYGQGGIMDAADLDQAGHYDDLLDFIEIDGKPPTKKLLEEKQTGGNQLPLKDEADVTSLQQTREIIYKRLHNTLTNKLRMSLGNYTLLEGCNNAAQYDALVKNYNSGENKNGDDLLIEVKSSNEPANIRMAIGQLYAYCFRLKLDGHKEPHLAILLPNEPDNELVQFLEWLDIGILWFSGSRLESSSQWLKALTDDN